MRSKGWALAGAGRISLPETLGRLVTDAQRSVRPEQSGETNGRTIFKTHIYLFGYPRS